MLRECRDDDGRMEHKERYARLPMLIAARTVGGVTEKVVRQRDQKQHKRLR